jgi:hypothetical protein
MVPNNRSEAPEARTLFRTIFIAVVSFTNIPGKLMVDEGRKTYCVQTFVRMPFTSE